MSLGVCLLDINCEDEAQNDHQSNGSTAAQEAVGTIDTCIHTFHAACIQVSINHKRERSIYAILDIIVVCVVEMGSARYFVSPM